MPSMIAAVFTPLHHVAATPEAQRYGITLRMLLQDPQIELHQIPADDPIGIVPFGPFVEFLQQPRTALAILEIEVEPAGVAIGWAQHIHLTLPAAFQRNGIQLAVRGGFDIERDQLQRRTISGVRLHLAVEPAAFAIRLAAEPDRRRDKALHQIAFVRTDVRLVDVDAILLQLLFELEQLAILTAVQPKNRTLMKIFQGEGAEFELAFVAQYPFGELALLGRNERHRRLGRQAQVVRTALGRQPEVDFCASRRVAPMSGQKETLLLLNHTATFYEPVIKLFIRLFYLAI
jgi:hypothetical protein